MKAIVVLFLVMLTITSHAQINSVSNGELISATKINELISKINSLSQEVTLLKSGRFIVKKATVGNNWYEIYNDGWVRQGGRIASHAMGNGAQNASWVVAIRDTSSLFNYNMIAYNNGYGGAQQNLSISAWTVNGFSYYTNDGQTGALFWHAEGYGSVSALQALGVTVTY